MNDKSADSAMPSILNSVLKLSAKLPAPLAYGPGVTVTFVLLVALQKGGITYNVLVFLSLVFLSALMAFVYQDARHREHLTPVKNAFLSIKEGLNRKTFNEPFVECSTQDWIDRFRGACETYVLLARYRGSIEVQGSDIEKVTYKRLLKEVDGYRMDLAAHLLQEIKFERGDDGKLVIPDRINKPCEEHRTACKELEQKIPY